MSRKSILIVDDEEVIRDFLDEVLEDIFDVSNACDGQEAIEKLQDGDFDLVITDMKMPRVTGEEVVKYVKANKPNTKVIVISGYLGMYSTKSTNETSPDSLLSKPFSIKQLKEVVSTVLGEAVD
ncbi:response regulator [candidate division GN15 bacterium]|nr:response regulator [candidate division GN15 bacterium]